MTDREVMQQALEALRSVQDHRPNDETNNAIAALRKRLVQPEQEPVAWMSPGRERLEFSRKDTVYGSHTIPLYASPPQRNPLTEEDDRLIAAAPDLLAALQGLLRGIANGPDEANAAMLVAKARDAINKATGKD